MILTFNSFNYAIEWCIFLQNLQDFQKCIPQFTGMVTTPDIGLQCYHYNIRCTFTRLLMMFTDFVPSTFVNKLCRIELVTDFNRMKHSTTQL